MSNMRVCSVTWFLMDSGQSDSGGTSAAACARAPRTPSVWASAPSNQSKDTRSLTHAHTHTLSVTPSNWIKAGSFSSQWRKRWGEEEDWQVDEEVPRCIVGKKELRQPETEELRRERSRVFIRTSLFFAVLTWLQHVRGVVTSSSPCGWPGRCFPAFRSFNCRMFLFGVSWLRLTLPGPNYLILQKKTRKPLKLELWQQASKNVTWDEFTTQTGNRIGAVYRQTF